MFEKLLAEYHYYHSNVVINPVYWALAMLIANASTWEQTRTLMQWNSVLHLEYLRWDKDSQSWQRR